MSLMVEASRAAAATLACVAASMDLTRVLLQRRAHRPIEHRHSTAQGDRNDTGPGVASEAELES
ncbi:hypothetical protein ACLQ2P_26615 [Actinomadura citrea]|uniref:hypothetical protein n=1 Tax=Actinomadura TaxID=1988 RepID=UPI0033C78651